MRCGGLIKQAGEGSCGVWLPQRPEMGGGVWSKGQKVRFNKSSEQHSSRIYHWLGFCCSLVAGRGAQRCDFAEVFGWHHVQTFAGSAQIHLHPVRRWQIAAQESRELLEWLSDTCISLWKQEHSAHGKVYILTVRRSVAGSGSICLGCSCSCLITLGTEGAFKWFRNGYNNNTEVSIGVSTLFFVASNRTN